MKDELLKQTVIQKRKHNFKLDTVFKKKET